MKVDLEKQKQNQNAITLITLVITIVILLILAAVTIRILNQTGLIDKTKYAKQKTEIAQAKEELQTKIFELQIDKNGNATLVDFTNYLKDDTDAIYIISLTKTASIIGEIPDVSSAKEIYVTYKEIEFRVDKELKVEYVGSIEVDAGNGETSGSTGESQTDPILKGCSRYIKVDVTHAFFGKMTLSVNIPNTDKIKNIQYYIDNTMVYEGTEKSYTVNGLDTDKEYEVYAIVEYENNKEVTKAISKNVPEADVYVSTTGNDSTGNGSVDKPYATLEKAINMAQSGQKIYIFPGEYELSGIEVSSWAKIGIHDWNKKLEIFGQNENTILIFDATNISERDAGAVCLQNASSILRNLTYVFKPKSGNNYQKSIFYYGYRNSIKCIF